MIKTTKLTYSAEDKREIIDTLIDAAVALAAYWDALRHAEIVATTDAEGVEIDTGYELLSNLAAECDVPPAQSQLRDDVVWKAFEDAAKVRTYPHTVRS